MFSVNVDKLIGMTAAEKASYANCVNTILEKGEEQCRTIAVVGEGINAFKLAAAFMEGGKRVLFIDGDISTDIFISKYRLGKSLCGIMNYLDGNEALENLICKTNKSNLDIVFTGEAENPEVAYAIEKKMPRLLAKYCEDYDLIVMLSDKGGDMAVYADVTVLMIEAAEYTEERAAKIVARLDEKGCYVMGVIINEA